MSNYNIFKLIDFTNNNIYITHTKYKYIKTCLKFYKRQFKSYTENKSKLLLNYFFILKNDNYDIELIEKLENSNIDDVKKRIEILCNENNNTINNIVFSKDELNNNTINNNTRNNNTNNKNDERIDNNVNNTINNTINNTCNIVNNNDVNNDVNNDIVNNNDVNNDIVNNNDVNNDNDNMNYLISQINNIKRNMKINNEKFKNELLNIQNIKKIKHSLNRCKNNKLLNKIEFKNNIKLIQFNKSLNHRLKKNIFLKWLNIVIIFKNQNNIINDDIEKKYSIMNTDVSTQYYNDNLESSKIYFKSLLTKRTKIQILEINYNKNLINRYFNQFKINCRLNKFNKQIHILNNQLIKHSNTLKKNKIDFNNDMKKHILNKITIKDNENKKMKIYKEIEHEKRKILINHIKQYQTNIKQNRIQYLENINKIQSKKRINNLIKAIHNYKEDILSNKRKFNNELSEYDFKKQIKLRKEQEQKEEDYYSLKEEYFKRNKKRIREEAEIMMKNNKRQEKCNRLIERRLKKKPVIKRMFKIEKFMMNKKNKFKFELFDNYKCIFKIKCQTHNYNVNKVYDIYINTIKEAQFKDYIKEYHNITNIKDMLLIERINIFYEYIMFYDIDVVFITQYKQNQIYNNDFKNNIIQCN